MMGLSHFNTSLVTPTPPLLGKLFSSKSQGSQPSSSILLTSSSNQLIRSHTQHTHLLEDLNLLLERTVPESIPTCEQPLSSIYQVSREEER